MRIKYGILLLLALMLASCAPASATPEAASPTPDAPAMATATQAVTATVAPTTVPALWIDPATPAELIQTIEKQGLPAAESAEMASVRLEPVNDSAAKGAVWIYALVAPFPTISDGVSTDNLKAAWLGNGPKLVMTEQTYSLVKFWFDGEPATGVVSLLPAEKIVDAIWADRNTYAIVPFEAIEPKMKVLEVDGQSPLRKDFAPEKYLLKVTYTLTPPLFDLPAGNRDPKKLTTIVMTGVTALVRATAVKMEEKGVNYPAQDIRNWLLDADIAHISNEIPFAVGCPYPNANQTRLIFCSDPKYIDLLEYVGADVIELTGNHFEDWGREATQHTVEMYRERAWPYYGGGADLADAQKPALIERNGVKFAFIGCNPVGPMFAWARADGWPGAAPCGKSWPGADKKGHGYEWMVDEIKRLKAEGYIVIATFQYHEYYSPDPRPWQMTDFRRMADAGATIVSGSQAHYSQAMEFYGTSFVHYGLGNLFFDQMGYDNPSSGKRTTNTRREFLDRHVFYDGKYLGTELLTAMLEDYAKPRPMTIEERYEFLKEYFEASGWK